MLAQSTLPGVRIDTQPQPAAEALPRSDIAVFVGFASMGPTHRPVVVESVARFAAIFGTDAPLAWDEERGERLHAHLGPTVRAFFANGGRRCWVIRVARTREFESVRTGVVRSDESGLAVANRFAVPGVLLGTKPGGALMPATAQARSVGSWSDSLRLSTALNAASFDMENLHRLPATAIPRIGFNTGVPLRRGDMIEFHDEDIQTFATVDGVVLTLDNRRHVEVTVQAVFQSLKLGDASPPASQAGKVHLGDAEISVAATLSAGDDGEAKLQFETPVPIPLTPGQWIHWLRGTTSVWLRIDSLSAATAPQSPMAGPIVRGRAWLELPPETVTTAPRSGALLTLDMRVTDDREQVFRRDSSGLTPFHAAAWWQEASDDRHYAGGSATNLQSQEARTFPLAARDEDLDAGDASPVWIPLGCTARFGPALGPVAQTATALERDGLAGWGADLFLDPELDRFSLNTIALEAEAIQFLREPTRRLFGLHGALSLGGGGAFNEATLISVPDAVHPGWSWAGPSPLPTAPAPVVEAEPCDCDFADCAATEIIAPMLAGPSEALRDGPFELSWTGGQGSVFELEEAERPDFADARRLFAGSGADYSVTPVRSGIFYYRLVAASGLSSNVVAVFVRNDRWIALQPVEFGRDGQDDFPRYDENELLRVHRSLLRMAAASGEFFAILGLPRHFRAGETIAYSSRLRANRVDNRNEPDSFAFNETACLSYGALYHPWIVSGAPLGNARERSDAQQIMLPPDGFAAGVLAGRATGRGPWVAPANEPLKDAVALTPAVDPTSWLALQDAHVNLFRAEPRGFLALNAETLSGELDLSQINVRRLITLLRRLALRRGSAYVFEPNDDRLRRSVERSFNTILDDLFRRGAFAGATPAESFKIRAGDAVGTPNDREVGRFLVELRVAPAWPLRFLAIRLAQSGERLTVQEEL